MFGPAAELKPAVHANGWLVSTAKRLQRHLWSRLWLRRRYAAAACHSAQFSRPNSPRCFPFYRRLKAKQRLLLKLRLLLKPKLLLKTNVTGDDPITIHLKAAIDNANEGEELPLAPWH